MPFYKRETSFLKRENPFYQKETSFLQRESLFYQKESPFYQKSSCDFDKIGSYTIYLNINDFCFHAFLKNDDIPKPNLVY